MAGTNLSFRSPGTFAGSEYRGYIEFNIDPYSEYSSHIWFTFDTIKNEDERYILLDEESSKKMSIHKEEGLVVYIDDITFNARLSEKKIRYIENHIENQDLPKHL